MKKILSLAFIATFLFSLSGCETKETDPAGARDTGVIPLISDLNPGIFIADDGASYISFVVALGEGDDVDAASVVVSHGTAFERVKISDISTFPATVTLSLSEVATTLGETVNDFAKGDVVYVEVETTLNGVTTRSNASLGVAVVCPFNAALTYGSYHAVSADWNSEGDITITPDATDQYTVYVKGLEEIEGLTEDLGPLPMHINPATFAVTAPKTAIASDAWGYHNISYGGTGTYNSCTGTYTMDFSISVDEGSFGTNRFVLTKN